MATRDASILFTAEYEPAELLGRRRVPRTPVSLDARVGRVGLDRTLCKVTDLSQHGARLQLYSALKTGAVIWLTLPRVGQFAAVGRWADDFSAGCQFRLPLDIADFEALVAS